MTGGNGYLLVVTDGKDNYLSSLTGMPQTKAVAPFKAPIDEDKIKIDWLPYTDEWGNKFPDGETYSPDLSGSDYSSRCILRTFGGYL